MKKFTLAIDFDGCIVDNKYPEIGELLPHAKNRINRLREDGHYVIIWTCRCDKEAEAAKEFLKQNEIGYDSFNENHPEHIKKFKNDSRKIFAHYYLDDRNLDSQINWSSMYEYIRTLARHQAGD